MNGGRNRTEATSDVCWHHFDENYCLVTRTVLYRKS
jgi:hypothetical protein